MGGRSWTMEEMRVLRECAGDGAAKVVSQLRNRCGSRRTQCAVQMQASRMGVSLWRRYECTGCGRVCRKDFWVPAKRLCKLCAAKDSGGPLPSRAELMAAAKVTAEDERALADARRNAGKMRQRRHREKARKDVKER